MRDKIETALLLDYYGGLLTEKQSDVMRLYCYRDMTIAEISEELGITRQGVLEFIDRSAEKLTDYEAKLGLVKKIRTVTVDLEKLIASISDDSIKERLHTVLKEIKEI